VRKQASTAEVMVLYVLAVAQLTHSILLCCSFLAGDTHWAEVMAMKIPARMNQLEVTLYEVTASGIDENWPFDIPNPYRLQLDGAVVPDPAQISVSASSENICTGDPFHVCSAQANYGGIEVDFSSSQVKMSIFTPHESTEVAASLTIRL
jgi:hypothetical protein